MFDTSILFDAFKATGMLSVATRLGQVPPVDLDVGFVQPDGLILGEAVQTTDVEVEYVTAAAVPPLRVGEALRIGTDIYRVRQPPRKSGDGTYSRSTLETVAQP